MGKDIQSRRLVVILHADIVGSTALVQLDEAIAHNRFQSAFRNFSKIIKAYSGLAHEIRGDALVAEFELTTDAVSASLAFQAQNLKTNKTYEDDIRPQLRIGISLGEVIIADKTITGSGVVMAQRLEQLADPGGIVVHSSIFDTVPRRMPYWFEPLGEQTLKGFDNPVRCFAVSLRQGEAIPKPEIKAKPRTDKPAASRTSKIGMSLLGVMMLTLIGIGTLILLDKPPEMQTLDYLAEKTERTYSRLQVRLEWIPVLFEKDGSTTKVGQQPVTDEKLSIVEVEGKAGSGGVTREKLISGGVQQEAEEKLAAEQALMLAQLELKTKIENEKRMQAERERQVEEERIAQQKKIEAEKEKQRQDELARQKAELERKKADERRLAELKRKQAEEKRLYELKRKQAEEKRLAELERKKAEEKRLAELMRKEAEEAKRQAELERQQAEKQKQVLSLLSTADLYFDNGDYANAQVHYKKVLALDPAEADKQRAMQRMENTEVALLVMKRSDLILLFHDVRGTYSSDISYLRRPSVKWEQFLGTKSDIEVILKQDKDQIIGTFSGERTGDIEGVLNGDVLKFKWWVTNTYGLSGRGEWKVTKDGLKLIGTWGTRGSRKGDWNLTRIE